MRTNSPPSADRRELAAGKRAIHQQSIIGKPALKLLGFSAQSLPIARETLQIHANFPLVTGARVKVSHDNRLRKYRKPWEKVVHSL